MTYPEIRYKKVMVMARDPPDLGIFGIRTKHTITDAFILKIPGPRKEE